MTVQSGHYYLAKDVFLCIAGGAVILLDLKNDKYISLEPEKTTSLMSLLSIQPEQLHSSTISMIKRKAGNRGVDRCRDDSSVREIVEDLIRHKLITTDSIAGSETNYTMINIPLLDLAGYEFGKTPDIKTGHIFKFFMASTVASLKLCFFSTEQIVKSVKERRKRQQIPSTPDLGKIKDLVEIYKVLRPLFFTAKDHCLFDSLALIEFLARYAQYPTWVFGVKMGPFSAHCWVQDHNFIYNEAFDIAHDFTPIMAV